MSEILDGFPPGLSGSKFFLLKNQMVTQTPKWHQICLINRYYPLDVCTSAIIGNGKLNGWVDGAENQGTTAGRNTLPTSLPEPREAVIGVGPSGMVVAVGLVRPPKDIVLWDESNAALKRLVKQNSDVPREARNSVNHSTPKNKEVKEDRHRKMA